MPFQVIIQKSLTYFNDTEIVAFSRIPLASLSTWASVFPNNLVFYLKDLKLSVFAILLSKLVASSLEYNHKLPVLSEWFELYSIKLYIGMTKSKSSASSVAVSSIVVIYGT